jgi:hypothetical protein
VVGADGAHLRHWEPARERLEDYTDARLTGLVRAAAGVPALPVRVLAKGAFSFAAQVAGRYLAGRPRRPRRRAGRRGAQAGSSARTAAACPSALTLCQARSTLPCSSTRKVERSTPTEVRP